MIAGFKSSLRNRPRRTGGDYGGQQPGKRDRIRVVTGYTNSGPVDGFNKRRPPAPIELVWAYRNASYVCANIQATGFASQPFRLYVTTRQGEVGPRLKTKALSREKERWLEGNPGISKRLSGVDRVDEVTESPILETYHWVNPWLNKFQLLELTQLYREIDGRDFWYWVSGLGDRPVQISPLPSWMVYVQPDFTGTDVVQRYVFTGGGGQSILDPDRLLFGRELNLIDPYTQGTSWLRANYQLAEIYDKQTAYRESTLANRGRPDAMLIPKEEGGEMTVDPDAIARIQGEYEQSFSMNRAGKLWVPPGGMTLSPLSWSPMDMGEIAEAKVVLHDIARASGTPIALVDGESANRANMDAALLQLARFGTLPRCRRFEEHQNSNFIPLWDQDDDGNSLDRLFIAFDHPVPADRVLEREENTRYVDAGILSRNDARSRIGEAPVEGGDVILVKQGLVPLSVAASITAADLKPENATRGGSTPGSADDKYEADRLTSDRDGGEAPEHDKPHEENDDAESDRPGKGLKVTKAEGEQRDPFFDIPTSATLLARSLKKLGHSQAYLDGTMTGSERHAVLHDLRLSARQWLRSEAEALVADLGYPVVAKGLFGDAADKTRKFFSRARRFVRETIVAGALTMLGPGRISDKEAEGIDRDIGAQHAFLDKFERDVIGVGLMPAGEPPSETAVELRFTPDEFAARAEMYGASVWPAGNNALLRRARGAEIFDEEKRTHVGPDRPCDVCVEQEDRGWSPIGTLKPIGDSPCLTSCHCHFSFRNSADGIEYLGGMMARLGSVFDA